MAGSNPKKLDAKLMLSAIIISGLIFVAGIMAGYSINRERLTSIEEELRGIMGDVQNFQLQMLFLDVLGENSTCPLLAATLADINKRSYNIGNRLTTYSSEGEIQDYEEYLSLKKEYSRLLIGYWLLAGKLRQSCDMKASTIIYLYSRECARCDDQAFILTYLKNKYKEDLLVFALDADLDEPSLQTVVNYYNITEFPGLVIDHKPYEGFHSADTIEKLMRL